MAHACLQKTVWEIKCCLASEKAYFLHGELRVAPYWAFLERGSTGGGRGETRKKGPKDEVPVPLLRALR